MYQYRDIHEYHDKCYYCICNKCKIDNCRLERCEFCEGGINYAKKRCRKKCHTVKSDNSIK